MVENQREDLTAKEEHQVPVTLHYVVDPWRGFWIVSAIEDETGAYHEVAFRNKERAQRFVDLDGFAHGRSEEVHEILNKRLWRK